jgi:hypothetical protein
MIFWLVLELEISYRRLIACRIWFLVEGFFKIYFCMMKYLSFHYSSLAVRYFLM